MLNILIILTILPALVPTLPALPTEANPKVDDPLDYVPSTAWFIIVMSNINVSELIRSSQKKNENRKCLRTQLAKYISKIKRKMETVVVMSKYLSCARVQVAIRMSSPNRA